MSQIAFCIINTIYMSRNVWEGVMQNILWNLRQKETRWYPWNASSICFLEIATKYLFNQTWSTDTHTMIKCTYHTLNLQIFMRRYSILCVFFKSSLWILVQIVPWGIGRHDNTTSTQHTQASFHQVAILYTLYREEKLSCINFCIGLLCKTTQNVECYFDKKLNTFTANWNK